jgi:hypothetical protein
LTEYFELIQNLLAASPFVHEPILSFDDRRNAWFLRGDIYFIDNSRLHVRELCIRQGNPVKIAYAYHYQDSSGRMVFRYDNAPHYPDIPTAPHHKHISEANVIAAYPPDFEAVLREIENLLVMKLECQRLNRRLTFAPETKSAALFLSRW